MTGRSVSIVGGGAWGSALAQVIAEAGTQAVLWNRTPKPGCTSVLSEAAPSGCEMVLAVAVQHAINVCQDMAAERIHPKVCWIASKGLDSSTGQILSAGVLSCFPKCIIGVFSGPNIASEIARGLHCGMTIACTDPETLHNGKSLFKKTHLSIETCDDIIGVQWWGALKNIMAIGYGFLQQLGVGHNMSATFLTRAAKELATIVMAKGGKSETTLSFAGIGDLILTSHCSLGRNRFYGEHFPQKPTRLVEGLDTLTGFKRHTLDSPDWTIPTPIVDTIYDVIAGILPLEQFPGALLDRVY